MGSSSPPTRVCQRNCLTVRFKASLPGSSPRCAYGRSPSACTSDGRVERRRWPTRRRSCSVSIPPCGRRWSAWRRRSCAASTRRSNSSSATPSLAAASNPRTRRRARLPHVARWIEPLAAAVAGAKAFRGYALRAARRDDEDFLFALHRSAMRDYVEATWGWDEDWQRQHFAATYAPAQHAVIVRLDPAPRDVGRISLTRHWRKIFLRDIELVASERNRGIGGAIIGSVLTLAANSGRHVELLVLKCNPAQRLYERMGFRPVSDDGARLRMRAL